MKKLVLGTLIFAILVFTAAVSAMDELTGTDNSITIFLSSEDAAALAEAKQDDSTAAVYDAEIVINGSSYTGTIQAASMEDMKTTMMPPEGSDGPQGNPPEKPQGGPNGQGPQGGPDGAGAPQGMPEGQGPQGGPAETPQGNPPEKPQGDFGGQAPEGIGPDDKNLMVSYKITIDSTEILLSAIPEMPEGAEQMEKPDGAPEIPDAVEAELTINDGSSLKVRITQNKQTTK